MLITIVTHTHTHTHRASVGIPDNCGKRKALYIIKKGEGGNK